MKTVCVSGGFDPIHVGHIRYLLAARELGDHLVVILNGDSFLMRKKGFVFMPSAERFEILQSVVGVDSVVLFESEQDTVIPALDAIRPQVFAKGGDRGPGNTPEMLWCADHGIEMVWGVGGSDKPQSSQWLTSRLVKNW